MKPQFALNLSFDDIALLLRGHEGWLVIDEVSLESKHLDQDLKNLITRAGDFSAAPVKTKVIIPNEQIKYLEIPVVEGTDNADLIKNNLQGATPYAIEDLAFDWCEANGTLQVAAVARETLDEAHEFASMYNFKPQGFVAIPPAGAFKGEVVFGLARSADDAVILRDDVPIAILGRAEDFETPPDTETAVAAVMPSLLGHKVRAEARGISEADSQVAKSTPIPDVAQSLRASAKANATGGMSFFSRRIEALRKPEAKKVVIAAPAPRTPSANANSEAEKLTLFGARDRSGRAAAIFSMLRAGAIAAVFFAICAIAIWYILDEQTEITLVPNETPAPIVTITDETPSVAAETPSVEPEAPTVTVESPPVEEVVQNVAQQTDANELTPEEKAELNSEDVEVTFDDATPETTQDTKTPDGLEVAGQDPVELSEEEIAARYAATGIWPIAPKEIPVTRQVPLTNFEVASIEAPLETQDAVSLADPNTFRGDRSITRMTPPAPFGTRLNLGENGLVIATPEGTLSPDGHMVYLGRPRTLPPSIPTRAEEQEIARTSRSGRLLSEIRPKARPFADVVEPAEIAPTIAAIPTRRPQKRPQSVEDAVANLAVAVVDQTVSRSPAPRPKLRPSNLNTTVREDTTQVASAAAPRRVDTSAAPRIPTRSNVAARATDRNALRINRVALIGVIGTAKNKRAIVIFENGRRRTVSVGDRLDGGRVAAIGDGQLKYTKGNRTITLKMPRG